jgi:hypothetical protein
MFRLFSILLIIGATTFINVVPSYANAVEVTNDMQHLPTPSNLSFNSFGLWIIGWGTGAEGARQRLDNIQREDVVIIKQKGVTQDMIKAWHSFYEQQSQNDINNPTARFRAKLMKKSSSFGRFAASI